MISRNGLVDDVLAEAKQAFIQGNYKIAEPILQQLILQNARNPEVYQMLATIFYDRGQFNKAIKTFRRALEIDPTYTDASVGLSIILNDLGRYDEGKKIFEDARTLLDKKSGAMDSYIEEKLAAKHEELADLYFQYQRYQDALEQLLKASKLSSRKMDIQMRVAECFVKMGDPSRAVKELRVVIREFPNSIQARMKLGVIYYNSGNLAEATEQWESILLRDPGHPEALKYLKMARAARITTLSF